MNYHNRKFKPISNTDNGQVSDDMVFHYKQVDRVVSCTYQGQNIVDGHLIGLVSASGSIEMSYHQVNSRGELMTGVCNSTPERMPNGKIRLHESWQWTSGDKSEGKSVLEEL